MNGASIWGMLLTIISGVLVFVIGQVILERVIKPLQEYKKIKSKISYLLAFYANVYTNPIMRDGRNTIQDRDHADKVALKLKEAACELVGFKQQKNKLVSKDNIEKANTNLLKLSCGLYTDSEHIDERIMQNEEYVKEIMKALNLK